MPRPASSTRSESKDVRGLLKTVRRLQVSLLMLAIPLLAVVIAAMGLSGKTMGGSGLSMLSSSSRVSSSDESWRKLVPALMSYNSMLPPLGCDRGISYEGTMLRMQSFAGRLVRGKGVKVVAVGGSTTAGAGAYRKNPYHKRYHEWLVDTFPALPGFNVSLVVNGLGATRSALFNACSQRMVTSEADLYIVEFAVNDPWNEPIDGPTRQGFEQLIRKLLRSHKVPAVVILNQHAWATARGTFYRSAERDLAAIGEYYDVPVLSMRDAIWNFVDKPGFWVNTSLSKHLEAMGPPEGASSWRARVAEGAPFLPIEHAYLYWDGVHPADMTGHRVLSDLLVEITRRATRRLLAEAAEWWRGGRVVPKLLRTPPPMLAGNWELNQSHCFMQDDIHDRTLAMSGFEWKPRKPEAATRTLQQWGFHTDKPDASLTISLDTTFNDAGGKEAALIAGEQAPEGAPPVDLVLAIVKSWGHYGLAKLRCESGCSCEQTIIDCKWQYNHTQASLVPVTVTQSKNCTFSITILPSTQNNGTKFEMRGALVVNHGSQLFSMPDKHGDVVAGNVNQKKRRLLSVRGLESGWETADNERHDERFWTPLPGEDETLPRLPDFLNA